MKDQRIKQLEKYVQEDPEDTFSLYALALELRDTDVGRTAELFEKLLNDFPDYDGTYYQAAEFFAEQGQRDKARAIYEKGINLFRETKNLKALAEIQNAYQNFEFDD